MNKAVETPAISAEDEALADLLRTLKARKYAFVTPGNGVIATMRRRLNRAKDGGLRDVLGWGLPFRPGALDREVEACLATAGRLEPTDDGLRATVRVSSVAGHLFLHSAYPTRAKDSVFLGPDTYRFANFLKTELDRRPPAAGAAAGVLDIGAGAGVGGVVAAKRLGAGRVTLSDVNPKALQLARVNAGEAGLDPTLALGPSYERVEGNFDLIVSNPPFIAKGGKVYSDGGGMLGAALSLEWATAGIRRLRPGGRLLMYTGSPIVEGRDALAEALAEAAAATEVELTYRELDPDIFGGLLDRPVYAEVERIAAVGIAVTRPGS